MSATTSRPGSIWTLFALFGILVFGTGAALHRERALFGATIGSVGMLNRVAEEFTYSVPFKVEGELNFAPDLATGRRNIPSRNTGNPGSSLVVTPGPVISQPQSLNDGATPSAIAGTPGAGGIIPLGSGSSGGSSPFTGSSGPGGSPGGGGSISTGTPDPTPTPAPTPTPPQTPNPPVGVVPEPATWAMMILGFAFIGGAMRRRRTGRVANGEAVAA